MIIGKVVGKSTTTQFKFLITNQTEKFQFIQVSNKDNINVLAQIIEIEKSLNEAIATCSVIGYRENNTLKNLGFPIYPGTDVYDSTDDFVIKTLGLENPSNGTFVGILNNRKNLKISLDLNRLLSKHIAILAKSGSGKTYSVSVLLEELIEKKIPILVIDPHGEYSSLKYPNKDINDKKDMVDFGIQSKGYLKEIIEFSPNTEINTEARPLKLNPKNIHPRDLLNILPTKLSYIQQGLLYSSLKNIGTVIDFDELIINLENEEGSTKFTIINIIEYLKNLGIFSDNYTEMGELIQQGKCSIINLNGINQDIQEIIVYKLVSDLFKERKLNSIPPFFLVVEEAQNFSPERSFKEAKSSSILRQVASEARKFGIGLAFISQRPSRLDKSILSQCSTQVILKITNPGDVKAISNSVEGITQETEKEIPNLPVGTAMITGIVDVPLFVKIRPRKSEHGGRAVNIFKEESKDFLSENKQFTSQGDLLPLIKQKISLEDYKIMNDKNSVKINLIPCIILNCKKEDDFNLLINLNSGELITDFSSGDGIKLNFDFNDLSNQQKKIFQISLKYNKFKPSELFSNSGLQFSDFYDSIKILKSKGYLVEENNLLVISKKYSLLSNIQGYACYEKLEYSQIDNYSIIPENYQPKYFEQLLSYSIKISNIKKCYLVTYV